MDGGKLLSVRSVRVVATGRAFTGAFLGASFLLAPHVAPNANGVVGALLAANIAWALVLLHVASRSRLFVYQLLRAPAWLMAIDLAIFTVLLYLTGGADSPYFSPFVILILGATLQWGSRGAMVMGLTTLAIFAPAGWPVFFGADQGALEAQTFVVRTGYVAVISVMLVTFGRHMERVVDELSRLSDPLAEPDVDAGPPMRECLRHALWVFGAERGMLLLEEMDEPYAALAIISHGRLETRRLTTTAEPWVTPDAADSVFLFHPGSGTTVIRQGRRTVAGPSAPLSPALMAEESFDRALVIPVASGDQSGWVLVFDHPEPANEDMTVGAMVGAQLSMALERWETQQTRRSAAAAEDRVRLAWDLHDGVLQFLAGAGLQLDSLAKTDLPADVRARIATLRLALTDEQLELRGFISTLHPIRGRATPPARALLEDMDQLAARLSRYWTIDVTADVAPADLKAPHRVSYDLSRIVREAVANAVRHGGASRVLVTARGEGDRLSVRIDDNGRGFAFESEMGPRDLSGVVQAPRSLHERVRALDGRLELRSTRKGASVMIDLPLRTR